MGITVFSDSKAPLLKGSKCVPFVVVPSGKIRKGEYSPVFSISSYLSANNLRDFYLSSSLLPLGIKTESKDFNVVPKIGTSAKLISGARPIYQLLKTIKASSQLQWFTNIVDTLLSFFEKT